MTMSSPRMASADPFESQKPSSEYTMFEDSLFHVLTASWTVSADCWKNG